jgi:hypothetical protein
MPEPQFVNCHFHGCNPQSGQLVDCVVYSKKEHKRLVAERNALVAALEEGIKAAKCLGSDGTYYFAVQDFRKTAEDAIAAMEGK